MPEIRTTMTADTSQFERAMKRSQRTATNTAKSTQSGFSKVATTFASVSAKAGALGLAIGGVATAMAALTGKNVDLARKSFEDLANSFNVSGDQMLTKMQEVSHGMVSDFDLMRAASKAMVLGLRPDAIVSFLEIAAASSKATGQTVTAAFEDITIGTARQSRLILDNLGIIVSVEKANEAYAKQLGVTVSALTDAQKAQAFQNAVMEAGQRQINLLGNDTEEMFNNTQQLVTMGKNAWNSFANVAGQALNFVSGLVLKVASGIERVKRVLGTFRSDAAEAATAAPEFVPASDTRVDETKTKQINGNGVAATQRRAELAKKQAAELDKIYNEINKTIDKHTKTEREIIEEDYKRKAEMAKGNYKLISDIEKAKNLELTLLQQQQYEESQAILDEQREELLSRRDQEIEELQEWLDRVMETENLSNEQRLEAEQLYRDRKQQIDDEARQLELEKEREMVEQVRQIEQEKKQIEERNHKIRMQGIQAFGQLALKHGGEIGEKIFMVTRGIAAAQAVVDTHAAVMKTMAATPYPFNIPLAAAQAAIGAAQVSAILSTSVGSSSVDASVGGGGGAARPSTNVDTVTPQAPTQQEEQRGSYIINIQGDIMNEDYVDLLAERISEAVQDRNVILKASEARSVRNI